MSFKNVTLFYAFAFGTIQREVLQNGIFQYFNSCFAFANRTQHQNAFIYSDSNYSLRIAISVLNYYPQQSTTTRYFLSAIFGEMIPAIIVDALL